MPVSHTLVASLFNQHVKCRANSGRSESQEDGVVKECFLNVTYALAYDGSRSVATIASAADAEGKIFKLHQGQHRICVNLTAPFNAIHCIRDCITQNGDNGRQNSYHQGGIYHQYQLRISSTSSTCHTLRLGIQDPRPLLSGVSRSAPPRNDHAYIVSASRSSAARPSQVPRMRRDGRHLTRRKPGNLLRELRGTARNQLICGPPAAAKRTSRPHPPAARRQRTLGT